MKRIIAAPDSFKESLSAQEAARRIAEGVRRVMPSAEVIQIPLSDGGEGLTEALVNAAGGLFHFREVTGPLGGKVKARFGILYDRNTAVIEMAAASGLPLIPRHQRNPLIATTFGTGELILEALEAGCQRLIIGIGGSATNDGGAGMAQALGVKLLNAEGNDIAPGASGLLELDSIDMRGIDPRLSQVEVLVATDVKNYLYGKEGAAYVYGPQKGATLEILPVLDQALVNLARVVERDLNIHVHDLPGAGAAGGMGAGLVAFAGGKLRPGLELVFDIVDFENRLAADVDLVITGEGGINAQSLYGKVPVGVAAKAKKYKIPVIALVGSIGSGAEQVYDAGIDALMSIAPGPISLEDSIARAGELLTDASSRVMRMILLGQQHGLRGRSF